jgi:hypothetical protein
MKIPDSTVTNGNNNVAAGSYATGVFGFLNQLDGSSAVIGPGRNLVTDPSR